MMLQHSYKALSYWYVKRNLRRAILFLCCLVSLSSCRTTTQTTPIAESVCDVRKYMPLSQGNQWIYTTTITNVQGQQTKTNDTLRVLRLDTYAGIPTYFLSQGYSKIRVLDSTRINFYLGGFSTPLDTIPQCGCAASEWWLPLLQCTASDQWQQRDTLRENLRSSLGGTPQDIVILSIYDCSVIPGTQGKTTIKGMERSFKTYTYTVRFHKEIIPDTLVLEDPSVRNITFSIQFVEGIGITSIEGNGFKKTLLNYSITGLTP
jgi:hypothetical protein